MSESERLAVNFVLLEFLASLRQDGSPPACSHLHFPTVSITNKTLQGDETPKCDECDNPKRPAEFRCSNDNASYCSGCWENTHQSRTQRTHQRVPITADECSKHGGELIDRYCDRRCSHRSSLMCRLCEEAHGHAGTPINDVAIEKRQELQRVVEQLQSRMADKSLLWSKTYSALHDAMTVLNSPDDRRFLSSYRDVHEQAVMVIDACMEEREDIQRLQQRLTEEIQLRHAAEAEAARLADELEQSKRASNFGRIRDSGPDSASEGDAERRRQKDPRGLRALFSANSGALDLRGKAIGDDECWLIADALKANSTLSTLDLSNNQIGDAACTMIGDALKINSALTTLYLSNNQIGDAGGTAIGDALKINSTLTTLHLRSNQVGVAGSAMLADVLKTNCTLIELDLSLNQIYDTGCTLIVGALKTNFTLTTLCLPNNQVGDAGCTAVADALKINSTLTSLNLSFNQIGDSGGALIGNALKFNASVAELNLSFNKIGNATCTSIGNALQTNTAITSLSLSYNLIGDTGCTSISEALKTNSTLTELKLSNNRISKAALLLVKSSFGLRRGNLYL